MKRQLRKHGKPTGLTIRDRFMGDEKFRAELEIQGWNMGNIETADQIAAQEPEQQVSRKQ